MQNGVDLDHCPIVLELRGGGKKLPKPFKFNVDWLKDQAYLELVMGLWILFDQSTHAHVVVHFLENLKWVKKDMIAWDHAKKI